MKGHILHCCNSLRNRITFIGLIKIHYTTSRYCTLCTVSLPLWLYTSDVFHSSIYKLLKTTLTIYQLNLTGLNKDKDPSSSRKKTLLIRTLTTVYRFLCTQSLFAPASLDMS